MLARRGPPGPARLGLAIAKKRIRRASARNRIKRLVRESFRYHAAELCGLDVVVLARGDGAASNRELLDSLATHWQRLGRALARPG